MADKRKIISLLKFLSKNLTRKQIAESTGISERTQRRYLAGEIPKVSKHRATIENFSEHSKTIKSVDKKDLQKAIHSYTRSEISGTFKTVLKPSKFYEFREIPLDISLVEFRDRELLQQLRELIKEKLNYNKKFTSIKMYVQVRNEETGEILYVFTVRSKANQTDNIESILTDVIGRVFTLKVNNYEGVAFIDSVKIYQFNVGEK